MNRLARPLAAITAALVFATALGCAGLQSTARDAAVRTLESDKEARRAFEKGVQEAVGAMCKRTAKGKGDRVEELCACAGETFLKGKSVRELYDLFENLEGKDAQKELKRVTKACM
jgi:hypothetical protein